jgi:type IV secretion system protein VirB5
MSLKRFIFGDKVSQSTSEKKIANKNTSNNPFISGAEGRKEWNDRYMNMAKSIKNWQLAFAAAMAMAVILAFVVAKIATESKVQPFVVETNNGMPYALKPMPTLSAHDQKLINFAVNQFIINAKTIISDTEAEKTLLNKVYAYSANNTINFLHDYYQTNNPFNLASQYTVSVKIINSLPISNDTWQVTWEETKRSTTGGNILGVTRWMANLTYKFGDVNPKFMNDNPFGLYITDITWSQSQGA